MLRPETSLAGRKWRYAKDGRGNFIVLEEDFPDRRPHLRIAREVSD